MLAAGLKASLEDVDDGGHDADDVYDDDEVLPPLLDDEVLLETAKARYDDILAKRSKKKAAGPVTPLTPLEKAEAFVDLLETENADDVFSYSGENLFTDGVKVGTWWRNATKVGGLIDEDNDVRVQLPCGYGKSQLAV